MGRFVIVAYRPKPGCEQGLDAVLARHMHVLSERQLVTDRPAYLMRGGDGTVVEVFEWRSAEAIEQAHADPEVGALWSEFARVCDYVPLSGLPEAGQMFAEFEALTP